MAEYKLINTEKWPRYEHFRKFYDEVSCAASLCDDIDVTELKNSCHDCGRSFYISMLYAVTAVVNAHDEFRLTAVDSPEYPALMPAVWDRVDPVHNVFHEDSETYTTIVTPWNEDYSTFCEYAEEDIARGRKLTIAAIPTGDNVFEVSCVPWRHFTSVGVGCDTYPLSPVVVWGRIIERDGRIMLPLSIQINHAAADGFHLARFINEVEEKARVLSDYIRQMKGRD